MSPSFFYLALFGLCVSLVRDWEKDKDATPSSLGVKDILHSQLRRSRLWQRVRGEGRCSAGASRGGGRRRKGRPAWLVVGLLLLSGDVELNPGPETRRGGEARTSVEMPPPKNILLEDEGKCR